MSGIAFDRTFSMATFEALRLVRLARSEAPHLPLTDLVDVVTHIQADGANHDFEAALALDAIVAVDYASLDSVSFYRVCIEACISNHRPVWVRTIPYGRKSFVQKLERDQAQCFEASGLMEDPPTDVIVDWWDYISRQTRSLSDQEKMRQARAAEKLSLERERERLAREGIDRQPIWTAIEDNWAGYDILSYDMTIDGVRPRMIEVKSTVASPLRFYISRNEWEQCQKIGSSYEIHVWDMRTGNLHVRNGTQLAAHVPEDRGSGRWSNLEVRLGGAP